MSGHRARPHLPGRHAIEAYGKGGFRFGGMSHQGSILCLPSGVYAWGAASMDEVDEAALAPVLDERADGAQFLLLGSGATLRRLPEALSFALRAQRLSVDTMATAAACATYNIMLGEGRPVAAALIAVP